MSNQDLTNLAALKAWLGLPASAAPSDATLANLITSSSRWIYAALSRPFLLPTACSETLDAEAARVFLRHWPVLSVASVALDGQSIPPSAAPSMMALLVALSHCRPKVMVPRQSSETNRPVRPSWL